MPGRGVVAYGLCVPYTLVAFHAHPDDEVLLTGGTLALAAAQGHRVVVVTATDGGGGLAAAAYGTGEALAAQRMNELHSAATALGVHRTQWLGYADSGLHGTLTAPDSDRSGQNPVAAVTFIQAHPEEAAERLAAILREEQADVLTGYDPRGGYGHPDHVRVHEVARRAAQLAGTPVLTEATVDRTKLALAARWGQRLRLLSPPDAENLATAYTAREHLTHAVDVRAVAAAKRAAMRAHASQATGGLRTLKLLGGLPLPVFRIALGTEWFVQVQPTPRAGAALQHDIFSVLDTLDGQR